MVPLKLPAPLPASPMPATPMSCESTTWIASEPLSAEIDPFGGATRVAATTGGRVPMLDQVTVELILM